MRSHSTTHPHLIRTIAAILVTLFLSLSTSSRSAQDALEARIQTIAATIPGNIGASVLLIESHQAFSFNGARHFPMQSVYKLPIAMAVLSKVESGSLQLDQRIQVLKSDLVPADFHSPIRDANPNGAQITLRELLRYSVSESDGTACDVLLRLIGFPYANAFLHRIGIHNIVIATTEREMSAGPMVQYRNWATPDEAVNLWQKLQQGTAGISPASRDLLFTWTTQTTTTLHRIKGLLPPGTVVAHKSGTSGVSNGIARATNDTGIITLPDGRHLAVAVFVSDSTASEADRESVIAKIARAAWDKFAK